ncbi:MAM and LDL-receptor class A domain-containing protein 1-like [Porites lutea]|uniref:MAM and LDL-receptor class A domain-containing protein 1-like n=1 Tax=Porites lutea TaxID=51062 RepID=UPI003CC67172
MKVLRWKAFLFTATVIVLCGGIGASSLNVSTETNSTSHEGNTTAVKEDREFVFLPGGCDFEVDFCKWTNEASRDDFDWLRHSGRTPSTKTGPSSDRTEEGHYIYVETSWPRKLGQTARLVGGPFSGIMCMRFYYHMYGRHIADLQIYLQDAKSGMENYVWGRYKNQGNAWKFSNATVYGNNYTVIFSARVGKTYQSDIALDDITFVNGTCDGKELKYVPQRLNETALPMLTGEPGTCNFDGGFCEWINLPLGDQFDWTLNSGKTGTMLTGPTEDHTGYQGGYIYVEASEPQMNGHKSLLMGPRMCGRMCMRFFYSMNGRRMGTLNVYKREGMRRDDLLWTMSGHQGTEWHEALVDIGGACYQILFEGVVGPSYLSDIAVDDIYLTKGTCCHLRQEKFDAGLIGNCTFDEGVCEWRNDHNDDFDWQLIEGATPSRETGPTAGYNGEGQYLYVESSEPRAVGDKAVLVSGVFKGLQCMRFMYHMHGQDIGSLSIYRFGDGIMKSLFWRRHGDQGDRWHEARITFPCNSTSYQIQVEAIISVWRSDIAIDNIKFTKGACPSFAPTTAPATTTRMTTTKSLISQQLLPENSCSFSGHFCSWINDNSDDFDWLLHSGATMTRETGPTSDAGGDGGYIYLEASLHTSGQKTRLLSGYMTGTQCLSFKFHMRGPGTGSLRINQMSKKSSRPRVVWYRVGDQGGDWNEARLNLFGNFYRISIEGVRGPTFAGDIAVDSIEVTPGRCKLVFSEEEIQSDSHLALGKCSFDNGFCRWRNEATEDRFDWSITEGETPSRGTGPMTGFGGSGKYAFIEASAPRRPGDKAILKIYGSGEDRCLSFAFHMSGTNVGSLSVYQQELGKGVSPAQVWIRSGNQGKRWQEAEVNIKGYHQYKVIIEAVRGQSYRGDIAIDEVGFVKGRCGQPSDKSAKKL